MELLVRLRSRAILLSFVVTSCTHNISSSLAVANADTLKLIQKGNVNFFKGEPFSGKVFKLDQNSGDTLYKHHYWEGLKNGSFKKFYHNNLLFEERTYKMGKKEGRHIRYWDNGNMAFEYHLKNDAYHGTLKAWNRKGQIIKFLNYSDGQEFGRQQLWYDNGAVRSNYLIKNNRRYGLLGTKNCVNVKQSIN